MRMSKRGIDNMPWVECRRLGAVLGLGGWLLVAPLAAHHAIVAKFNPDEPVALNGTVTKVDWSNPHVHVFMDVLGAGGISNLAIELESTVDLDAGGWSPDALRLGERITVEGIAARDGSLQAWAHSMTRTDSGAAVFDIPDPVPPSAPASSGPTPRWPDGQPRLGPPPGESGYWGNPTATVLVEDGVDVAVNSDRLLLNLDDARQSGPVAALGAGVVRIQAARFPEIRSGVLAVHSSRRSKTVSTSIRHSVCGATGPGTYLRSCRQR